MGGAPPKRQRRNRVSFARKFFHATSDIYLQVNTNLALPTCTPDLIGQVITCPTKKNNNLYSINWIHPVGQKTWPVDLKPHIRCFFPKDQLRPLLPGLIKLYHDHQVADQVAGGTTNTVAIVAPILQNEDEMQINAVPAVIETPTISQRAAFAQVYTAGSSVSAISSLGHSQPLTSSTSTISSRRSTKVIISFRRP